MKSRLMKWLYLVLSVLVALVAFPVADTWTPPQTDAELQPWVTALGVVSMTLAMVGGVVLTFMTIDYFDPPALFSDWVLFLSLALCLLFTPVTILAIQCEQHLRRNIETSALFEESVDPVLCKQHKYRHICDRCEKVVVPRRSGYCKGCWDEMFKEHREQHPEQFPAVIK